MGAVPSDTYQSTVFSEGDDIDLRFWGLKLDGWFDDVGGFDDAFTIFEGKRGGRGISGVMRVDERW